MQRVLTRVAVTFLIGILFACGGSNGRDDDGYVRYIHLSPDVGLLNIQAEEEEEFGDDILYGINGVAYLESTGYYPTRSGLIDFEIRSVRTGEQVLGDNFFISRDDYYTIFIADSADSLDFIFSEDDRGTPHSGFAWIRGIHGSASAPTVDIHLTAPGEVMTDKPTFENVNFRDVSDYLEVPAGTYRIRVTISDTFEVLSDSGTLNVSANQVLSAIAVDARGGGAPYDLLLIDDRK